MRAPRSTPTATLLLLLALLAAAPSVLAQQAAPKRAAGASGLPLPRFASLAASEVNVRTGPGTEFPIRWVYTRPGLPVRILEEFDVWRLIEDPDGGQGWAKSNLLSTKRNMVVRNGTQELHRSGDPGSRVVLRAEAGVVGEFLSCASGWCRVEIDGRRGWLPRANMWGTLPGEGE